MEGEQLKETSSEGENMIREGKRRKMTRINCRCSYLKRVHREKERGGEKYGKKRVLGLERLSSIYIIEFLVHDAIRCSVGEMPAFTQMWHAKV